MNANEYVVFIRDGISPSDLIARVTEDYGLTVEDECHISDETLTIFHAKSPSEASSIVNEVNRKEDEFRAVTLFDFSKKIGEEKVNFTPVTSLDAHGVINGDKECFVILDGNRAAAYFNDTGGCEEGPVIEKVNKVLVSNTGKFVAVYTRFLEIRIGRSLDPFFTIYEDEIRRFEFTETDKFLVVYGRYKVRVWSMQKMEVVYELEATDVVFDEAHERMYVPDECDMFNIDSTFATFDLPISKVSFCGERMGVLSDEKIKSVYLITDEGRTKKSHLDIDDVRFFWSESFMYVAFDKIVGSRILHFVECYNLKKVITYKSPNKILDMKVHDEWAVLIDSAMNVVFLSKKGIFNEVLRVKKKRNIIASMNSSGKVVAICDVDSSTIEFYGEGALINTSRHAYCNGLRWSASGLFLASISFNVEFGGIVQMYTCNGTLLWKSSMGVIKDFQWCAYPKLPESHKSSIKSRYEELSKNLPKKVISTPDDVDVDSMRNEWVSFLSSKIRLIEEFNKMNCVSKQTPSDSELTK